jgi:hypothetical protein
MVHNVAEKKPKAVRKKKQKEVKPLMTSQCTYALLIGTPENKTYQLNISSEELKAYVQSRGSVQLIDKEFETIKLR